MSSIFGDVELIGRLIFKKSVLNIASIICLIGSEYGVAKIIKPYNPMNIKRNA